MMSTRMCALLLAAVLLLTVISPAAASDTMLTRCNVVIRQSASSSAAALTTLKGGTEVSVLGKSGSWTRVQYSSYKGYIFSSYLMTQSADGYYTLKDGDNNPYVVELEKRLVALNYLGEAADAKYDSVTVAAVKAFQKANGLSADGAAGPATQKKLFSDETVAGSAGSAVSSGGSGTAASGSTEINTGSTTLSAGTTTSYTLLKEGMESSAVKALQQRLIALGYLTGSATGFYGTATKASVKAFQEKNKLTVDGMAGSVTQALLFSNGAVSSSGTAASATPSTPAAGANTEINTGSTTTGSTTTASYTTLKKGMTSSAVKTLQDQLITLGYLTTSATGYYGSATYAAVKAFQTANGLDSDGVAGSETQTKLFSTAAVTYTYATLKPGTTSDDVTLLQKRLIALGYLTGSATGYYGTATQAAVKAFQSANSLDADGVAGKATQQKLYGSTAVGATGGSASTGSGTTGSGTTASTSGNGKMSAPAASKVKLLHWFNVVKGKISNGDILLVFDPATNYCWNLRAYSRGRHLDAEPLTADDTAYLNAAFGGVTTWTPKCVYVQLTDGTWVFAATHNTPHESQSIKTNNFDGHLCVHFLRDMSEAQQNDPNYGVTNQTAIRDGWKKLTGETVN